MSEKFTDYWKEGLPHLDTVTYKPHTDENVRVVNLTNGELDMIGDVPPKVDPVAAKKHLNKAGVGLQLSAFLGGAVITETIFSIPGFGRLVVQSIFNRDFPMLEGSILIMALIVIIEIFIAIFDTDDLGRDILSIVIYGSRSQLLRTGYPTTCSCWMKNMTYIYIFLKLLSFHLN